jgi:hypothetical protein
VVEGDLEGRPSAIRSLAGVSFQTRESRFASHGQTDVYSDEYEWPCLHAPNDKAPESWRIDVGGPDAAKPSSALLNIFCHELPDLYPPVIKALNLECQDGRLCTTPAKVSMLLSQGKTAKLAAI